VIGRVARVTNRLHRLRTRMGGQEFRFSSVTPRRN
jgi:hypothetical protein